MRSTVITEKGASLFFSEGGNRNVLQKIWRKMGFGLGKWERERDGLTEKEEEEEEEEEEKEEEEEENAHECMEVTLAHIDRLKKKNQHIQHLFSLFVCAYIKIKGRKIDFKFGTRCIVECWPRGTGCPTKNGLFLPLSTTLKT